MAYNKTEIVEQAIKAIQEHDLTTIDEVEDYLPCGMSILYTDEWKVEVLEPIKKEIERKKVSLKAKMKAAWRKADSNPTLQIAAFKLMATDEELDKLTTNTNKNEHSGELGINWVETRNYQTK